MELGAWEEAVVVVVNLLLSSPGGLVDLERLGMVAESQWPKRGPVDDNLC